MPTYSQNVSFSSPQALLAPDLSVEQQQVQRQSDLASALRQMSLEQIDAGKGNIAWTQGAAKLAQALAGRIVQNRADKQQLKLNQAFAGRMGSMFGTAGGGGQASGGGGAPSPPPSISPPQAASPAPPMTPSVLQPPPMRPQADPLAPMPEQGAPMPQQAPQPQMAPQPQEAPQEQPQMPQQPQRGLWSMTGDPQRDMALYASNPEEYTKGLIANAGKGAAPTDIEVMQSHLIEAAKRGDMGAVTAISQAMQKANRMPIESVRQNSIGYDPNTGQYRYTPKLGDGQTPTIDATGNVTGVNVLPGAAQSEQVMAQAEASGKGAGGAQYDLVTVVGPDGTPHQVPKSLLTGGGGAPPPVSPAGGGGSLNSYYGRGGASGSPAGAPMTNQSGLSPQDQAATTGAGRNSANIFNDAITGAATAKDAMRSINLITTAAKGLPTGAGSDTLSTIKSRVNAMTTGMGGSPVFNTGNIAKFDEIKKNVANLANQLSSGAGATGTDARLTNAINSLPNSHYAPAAIQEVGLNLKALAARNVAYGAAAAQWQQQHGPGSAAAFQGQWQKAYNPDLFYHVQKGDLAGWAKGMSATARNRVLDQYRALKGLGAQF